MTLAELKLLALSWMGQNFVQLLITVTIVVLYVVLDRIGAPRFTKSADRAEFKAAAASKAIRVARLITGLFGALVLMIVWGIDLSAVLIVATTTITLLGVALFASWSMLSNITAHFVLLLHPTFTRGTFIRVLDGDNYVQGYISDLSLFSVELLTEEKETIVYPNNLLLGRVTLVNTGSRSGAAGKLSVTPVAANPKPPATLGQ